MGISLVRIYTYISTFLKGWHLRYFTGINPVISVINACKLHLCLCGNHLEQQTDSLWTWCNHVTHTERWEWCRHWLPWVPSRCRLYRRTHRCPRTWRPPCRSAGQTTRCAESSGCLGEPGSLWVWAGRLWSHSERTRSGVHPPPRCLGYCSASARPGWVGLDKIRSHYMR